MITSPASSAIPIDIMPSKEAIKSVRMKVMITPTVNINAA
ncbi:hypothetical protein yberc0001_38980 [Yersinia bercovieri ATCC 43970]|uniref:Uncharacterized protein n=1 Tax=Yersinia bercovieri ATCC 43970 TaxID=349968 RepID=A0ABP2DX02_YERBE|nr:hypothetical protein yberc0001_38980 [Yersinia bercovieri ATCC 43970]